MPRLFSSLLLSLLIASSASAVTMAWTPIGNPGNPADPSHPNQNCGPNDFDPCGSLAAPFQIGTYEVTNAQYAEFLNAKAASDPLGLYNAKMGNPNPDSNGRGGIERNGVSGSFTYSAITGREDMPVGYVSFYDALRFANWLNNGQGNGSTETGAYTLLGGTATPSNGTTVTRNPGVAVFLPSENEWYKAAYYDSATTSYFAYPTGSNTQTTCAAPGATTNTANCGNVVGDLTDVGSYTGSASPYGAFDMGGNVYEWVEKPTQSGGYRSVFGGDWFNQSDSLNSAVAGSLCQPSCEFSNVGLRLVMIPEPGTGLLVLAGLLGFASWRKARS